MCIQVCLEAKMGIASTTPSAEGAGIGKRKASKPACGYMEGLQPHR